MDSPNKKTAHGGKSLKLCGYSTMVRFSFRQNLIFLLLAFVVFMCMFPVRLTILLQNKVTDISLEEYYESLFESVFNPNGGGVFAVTLILAFAFSVLMFSYLHSKRSVNFYHSMPVRREAHLLASVTVSVIYYVIAFFSSLFVSAIILFATKTDAGLLIDALKCFLFNSSYFIFMTAFFAFFAVISGSIGTHAFLSVAGLGAVPALHMLTLLFAKMGQKTLDLSYFYTETMLALESPVTFYYIVTKNVIEMSVARFILTFLGFIAAAALILFFDILIYKKVASENAGNPIFFRKLGTVIKYVFTYGVMLFVGFLVYELLYGTAGKFIGTLIGVFVSGFIAFSVTNVILFRNRKKFFAGMRGFAIFFAVFVVLFSASFFDILNLDSKMPSAESLKQMKIRVNDETIILNDEKNMNTVLSRINTRDGGIEEFIFVEMKLNNGFTFGKSLTAKFDEEMLKMIFATSVKKENLDYITENEDRIFSLTVNEAGSIGANKFKGLIDALRKDLEKIGYDTSDKSVITRIRFSLSSDSKLNLLGGKQENFYFDLTADMTETIEYLKTCYRNIPLSYSEIAEYIEKIVINGDEENAIIDKEEIAEVFASSTVYDKYNPFQIGKSAVDEKYIIEIFLVQETDYYFMESDRAFFKGMVPDFIVSGSD